MTLEWGLCLAIICLIGIGTGILLEGTAVGIIYGLLWTAIFLRFGFCPKSFWYSGAVSALIILSITDWQTFEIPFGCNLWIGTMGIGNLITSCAAGGLQAAVPYMLGAVIVSGALQIIFWISKGAAIGGGDIKLMCSAGLLLGWRGILWALVLGCMAGSVIHPFLIKWKNKSHVLPFGPYLSFGIIIAMMWEMEITYWYAGLL